jgi:hypothetical protein
MYAVRSKQQYECEQRRPRQEQRNNAENNRENSTQCDCPPVLRQEVAHRIISRGPVIGRRRSLLERHCEILQKIRSK